MSNSNDGNGNMTDLAKRLLALDHKAYHEFENHFRPKLYSKCRSYNLPAWEAEDIALTLLTDILTEKLDRYDHRKNNNFEAWVMSVANNLLRNQLKKKERHFPFLEQVLINIVSETPKENINKKLYRSVRAAWKELSGKYRDIITLRYYRNDYTFEEIGKELGLKNGTARVQHHRALKQLKKIMEENPYVMDMINKNNNKKECDNSDEK